jgi:hypothetical protein
MNPQVAGPLSSSSIAENGSVTAHPDSGPSWMNPGAKASKLLYVSDAGLWDVFVFSYPDATYMGTLSGFDEPQGECVDKAGDVYIASTGSSQIMEYAHGGKKPLRYLSLPGQDPGSCAVDLKSGDLAVTNVIAINNGPGSVWIYKNATGKPKKYSDRSLARVYFAGYDTMGNLFVDGFDTRGHFQLAKFANEKFTTIKPKGAKIHFAGAVQYADGSLAVGDQYGNGQNSVIYQMSEAGVISGNTQLLSSSTAIQCSIQQKDVACANQGPGTANALFYNYPAGGSPTKTLSGYFSQPVGLTVSK